MVTQAPSTTNARTPKTRQARFGEPRGGPPSSRKKALDKCEHRLKPKDRASNVTAGCKHTPLRSVASLLRKHCPRPTNADQYSACSRKIMRTTLRAIHESPVKNNRREQNAMVENRIPLLNRRGRRPRRPVKKQTARTNTTAAHHRTVGAITYLRSKCAMKRSEILNRPPENKRQEPNNMAAHQIPHLL